MSSALSGGSVVVENLVWHYGCASLQDEPELGADGFLSIYMGVHGVVSVLV